MKPANISVVTAVASNRPTEALASVLSFTFVVYSHLIPRKRTQPWTDCLGHKSSMDIASVISFFWLRPCKGMGGEYSEAPPHFFNRNKKEVYLLFLSVLTMTVYSMNLVMLSDYEWSIHIAGRQFIDPEMWNRILHLLYRLQSIQVHTCKKV